MPFIYTRDNLKNAVNREIHQRIGMLDDPDDTVNRAVRGYFARRDLRSAKRKVPLVPNLFNGINNYAAPSGLSGNRIVDLPAQAKRQDGEFSLIPSSEFSVNARPGDIAVRDYNGVRILQVVSQVDSKHIVASELDSLSSGSSDGSDWAAFGSATDVEEDDADYIKGNGSIKFSFPAAAPTAGISHGAINPVDMTDYLDGTSSWFVWCNLESAVGVTALGLRFGLNGLNYRLKTVTAQHDGSAFVDGWNLIRFDLSGLSTVGAPDDAAVVYFVPYVVGGASLAAGTAKFDWLVLMKGVRHDVEYYGCRGWINAAGAYVENSTDDSDLLVAYADEFELLVLECSVNAAREVHDHELSKALKLELKEKWVDYMLANPSEAKVMTNEYRRFITE